VGGEKAEKAGVVHGAGCLEVEALGVLQELILGAFLGCALENTL
jgi:hypothetical protein